MGSWVRIHSRSAALIRVCQPRPPALKWASTSGDNRMVVDTFGVATGGRPRRARARANFAGHSPADRSGAVSGSKSGGVERSFPFIGFPHADNPIRAAARSPHQDHHHGVEKPDGNETILAIVLSVILDGQRRTRDTSPARAMSRPRAASVAARFASSNSIVIVFLLLH